MRLENPRLGKFLQVGARAALHLRRTGNTAEWKTIACRAGEGVQGAARIIGCAAGCSRCAGCAGWAAVRLRVSVRI